MMTSLFVQIVNKQKDEIQLIVHKYKHENIVKSDERVRKMRGYNNNEFCTKHLYENGK